MTLLLFPDKSPLILDTAQTGTFVKWFEAIVPVLSWRHERLVSAAFERDALHHIKVFVIIKTENYCSWDGNKASQSSVFPQTFLSRNKIIIMCRHCRLILLHCVTKLFQKGDTSIHYLCMSTSLFYTMLLAFLRGQHLLMISKNRQMIVHSASRIEYNILYWSQAGKSILSTL